MVASRGGASSFDAEMSGRRRGTASLMERGELLLLTLRTGCCGFLESCKLSSEAGQERSRREGIANEEGRKEVRKSAGLVQIKVRFPLSSRNESELGRK